MKRITKYAMIFLVAFPAIVLAAYALGSKSNTSGGWKVTEIQQTCTGLTTKQDCLAAQKVSGFASWILYVKNTGAVSLTDLDILVHYENANWDDAAINMTDAQPFSTDWNTGCVVTLAADTVCAVGLGVAEPVGWIKVQASAGTATSVEVTLIGRIP